MVSELALRKAATGWQFVSEAALEKFIWQNLQELFGIYPLRQQYVCQGEISDILAVDVDNEGGLVVLELKNVEDRYLVQQLTRYYANLLEDKPFQEKINYSHPVKLIAIAPSYHRHNLIDKKHSNLEFDLLKFTIVDKEDKFYFVLQDLELKIVKEFLLNYQLPKIPVVTNIPEPPKVLIEWLGSCSVREQTEFLKIRSRILSCSPKMKEMVDKKNIQYGSGKNKLCAEICFHQKSQKPILFLWLPLPKTSNFSLWTNKVNPNDPVEWLNKVGRTRVWSDGQKISHVGHTPEGFGKMKLLSEWDLTPLVQYQFGLIHLNQSEIERLVSSQRFKDVAWIKSHLPINVKNYLDSTSKNLNYWEYLSNLAIEKWLEKE
jgi:RecB family endonuclease NucS